MYRIDVATAVAYLGAGLGCLPAVRAQKRPAVGSWRTWSERLPTRIEVESWFANAHDAICIVAGAVSGNLECMDFDNGGELFEAWRARVDPRLLDRLVFERTPSGGYHVLYRSQDPVDGNLKLARGLRNGRQTTLIETRGEGGLFLCAPTEGYSLVHGAFPDLPVLAPGERKGLLEAARALDEHIAIVAPPAAPERPQGDSGAFLARPGDDFAARGDVRPYLQLAGWRISGNNADNELWTRPGKDPRSGASATFNGQVFYVFSSNAAPFESGRGYNQFQVYAMLEHGGDFTAAARTLLSRGFGKALDPLEGVDVSKLASGTAALSQNLTVGVLPTGGGDTPSAAGVQDDSAAPAAHDDFMTVDELVGRYPRMRPVLIHGHLRLGETMNVIAPPKTGKSWLVTDLALSVATGTPWFGYPCEQGDVLIIDNELHPETSASRIPKVIEARGFDLGRVGPHIAIANLRGRLKTVDDIANHIARYRERGFKLIIVDAFYRAVPLGTDENDNAAITGLYNMIDRFAAEIGCAFCLIHHTSKGNQAGKSVTDVGAGAGSQSRAADAHVILRRHKEKGVVVVDSVVRSFPSTEPFCIRWNWPLWERDDTLSTEDLEGKAEMTVRRRPTGVEEVHAIESVVDRVPDLVDDGAPMNKGSFILRIQKAFDVGRSKATMILCEALAKGYVTCERKPGAENLDRTKFVMRGPVPPGGTNADAAVGEWDDDED